jgi:hypothetical protein
MQLQHQWLSLMLNAELYRHPGLLQQAAAVAFEYYCDERAAALAAAAAAR